MEPGTERNSKSSTTSAEELWAAVESDPRVGWRVCGEDRYLYRPDQILVDAAYEDRLKPFLDEAGAKRARLRCSEGRRLEALGVRLWELVRRDKDAPDVVDALRQQLHGLSPEEQAEAVSVNHIFAAAVVYKFGPGDLPHPDTPDEVTAESPKGGGTGAGVRVAVLDTGFVKSSTTHPLLAKNYSDDGDDRDAQYDDVNNDILSVVGGHGTFIAGIIRQKAPDTQLDPEVTLDDLLLVDDRELAEDLLRLAPADIVNLSLAGPTAGQARPPATAKVLRDLGETSKTVVVAAAGNDFELATESNQPNRKMWPAAFGKEPGFEHVVGVAAVDRKKTPAAFTNRGDWVVACSYGVEERSTYVVGDLALPTGPVAFLHATARWSGTSFATPRVVGAIAAAMTASDKPISARAALLQILADAPVVSAELGKFID